MNPHQATTQNGISPMSSTQPDPSPDSLALLWQPTPQHPFNPQALQQHGPPLPRLAQHHVGGVEALSSHAQQPLDSLMKHPPYTQHNAPFSGDSQIVPTFGPTSAIETPTHIDLVSSMSAPKRQRRRKAKTLRESDWAPYQDRIYELYVEQGKTLEEVMKAINGPAFKADARQYKFRINQWGLDKKVKTEEMKAIVRKRQWRTLHEPEKGELAFEVRGKQVDSHHIERFIKRHKITESAALRLSPEVATPSDVECYTDSDRGSPAQMSDSSPTLSTVSIMMRPPNNIFPGSPKHAYRSSDRTRAAVSILCDIGASDIWLEAGVASRYRVHEEYALLCQIKQVELFDGTNHENLMYMQCKLVNILIGQGRYGIAEIVARKVVGSYRAPWTTEDDDGEDKLYALNTLGDALRYQGVYKDAEKLLRRVIRGRERVLGHEHSNTLASVTRLGYVLAIQGKKREAEAMFRRDMIGNEKVFGRWSISLAFSYYSMAFVLDEQEAEESARQALEIFETKRGSEDPDTLACKHRLAQLLQDQGKHQEAERTFQQVLETRENILGPEHPHTLVTLEDLAYSCYEQQRHEDAVELCRRAYKGLVKVLGAQHPFTENCYQNYEAIKRQTLREHV